MGDKHTEGSPFYSQRRRIRRAAGLGRRDHDLSPGARPTNGPAGPEDLAAAVALAARERRAITAAIPDKIVLCGPSPPGAAHVAGYVAHTRFHAAERGGIAGAVLMSGIYDTAQHHAQRLPPRLLRRGARRVGRGLDAGRACSIRTCRCCLTVSEFDPADFQARPPAWPANGASAKGDVSRAAPAGRAQPPVPRARAWFAGDGRGGSWWRTSSRDRLRPARTASISWARRGTFVR